MGRLDDVLARGTVSAADGTKKMRVVQVRLLADEVRDDLEHVEPLGLHLSRSTMNSRKLLRHSSAAIAATA